MQARIVRIGRLLVDHGPQHVGMPHVRPIGDKLWEIRATGRDGIARAFYMTASDRRIIVVHAIVKKAQKTPPREIAVARERMKRYT